MTNGRSPTQIVNDIKRRANKKHVGEGETLKRILVDNMEQRLSKAIEEATQIENQYKKYSSPYFLLIDDYNKDVVIEWLFDNRIPYKLEPLKIDAEYLFEQLVLQTDEDYMAFKLMFGEGGDG